MATTTNDKALLSSVEDMHAIASGCLSQIRGIARCTLRSLESEMGARDLESIAEALSAIAQSADMVYNDMAVEAERHGIQTVDAAWERRLKAMPKRSPSVEVTGRD